MANRQRGEVGFEADGQSYTLAFSINALCELEDAMKMEIENIGEKFDGGTVSMRDLRLMVWAGLSDHHDVDLKEAGRITQAVGLTQMAELVVSAFRLTFPQAETEASAPSGK